MANNENAENQVVPQAGTNTVVEQSAVLGSVAAEDLEMVAQWTKNDLFEKVRFLYNPDHELRADGPLKKLFVRDCKSRLLGLKAAAGANEEELYLNMLWAEANKKKRNLVAVGLTTRRSSVYSAMQNRFVGEWGGVSYFNGDCVSDLLPFFFDRRPVQLLYQEKHHLSVS